jgi:hypothetical protein
MSTEKEGFFKAKRIIVEAIDAQMKTLNESETRANMFDPIQEARWQALYDLRQFIRNGVLYESSIRGRSTESEE